MEDQKDYSYCPKCGMKYSINNTNGYCIHCGCNINEVLSGKESVDFNQQLVQQQTTIPQEEKTPKGAVAFLVLSSIGVLGLPLIVKFGVLWVMLAALGNSTTEYYVGLYIFWGIVIASIVSLPAAVINILLKGRHTKKCIIIVAILTIIGLFVPSIIFKTGFKLSDIGLKKAQIEENKIIYQDDKYTIKQKEVKYNSQKITIKLEVDGDFASVPSIYGRINKCNVYLVVDKDENEDNIYIASVSKEQLNHYQIKEPKEIELNLPISGRKIVTIKTDKATSNNQQQLSFEKEGLLYQNEYFKIYYNPEVDYYADIYIESLVSEEYDVSFKDFDFDIKGYIQSIANFNTRDYSISHKQLNYYPCNNNLTYLKGEYKIVDSSSKDEITSGIINETYALPKIDKRRCNES